MKQLPIKRKTVRAQYSRTYSWKFKRFWGGDLISVALPTPLVPVTVRCPSRANLPRWGRGRINYRPSCFAPYPCLCVFKTLNYRINPVVPASRQQIPRRRVRLGGSPGTGITGRGRAHGSEVPG